MARGLHAPRRVAKATSFTDAIAKTREVLRAARLGLADLRGDDPARRMTGLYNVVVFGRSVTLVLQNLRTIDTERFNAWYGPREESMRADPLLRYFIELRNEILKQGPPAVVKTVNIARFNDSEAARLPRPPGATRFFIGGDGTGWWVPMPDGSEQRYYITPPPHWGISTWFHLPNPPMQHLGKALADTSAQNLCDLYIRFLTRLVTAAERHFATRPRKAPAPRSAPAKRRRPKSGRSRPT